LPVNVEKRITNYETARIGGRAETNSDATINPTFAGFRRFCGQDRALDRFEQWQCAVAASKARSKLLIEGAKALHCRDLGTPAQTSPISARCMILPKLMLVRVVPGGGRSATGF
jgi:hypothetical protein